MKLTKKEEAALLKVYDTWWDSYLNGDIETYDSFLDKDFRFVGSTGSEEFLNRKDTTTFFEATAEQFAGKAKRENVIRTIEPLEGMVLITDLADTYVKDGTEWAYYARFRFTSLLRKTDQGWRFFYQHFSTPDLMANEGETIGIDKVSAENLELRTAIKRRTTELELKNRKLEVEAALERIRAKVTSMSQSSDLLDIVVAMRAEFVSLGHEAHYFWHMRWLPNMYQKAMTSGDGARIGMIMELPRDFHSHYEGMDEWENNQEPIIVLALETEIAVDYIDKMIRQGNFQQVDPNAPSLDDVRHIGGLTFVSAKTTHGEIGYSLPGVVKNPPQEDLDLLVRFAATFDLAHKRFEDLKRSEQQYRETQIELALEKVRARTMAMHGSSELAETAAVIFQQFNELGVSPERLNIGIVKEEERLIEFWSTEQGGKRINQLFKGSIDEPTTISKVYAAWKSDKKSIVIDLSGQELKDWLAYLTEEMGLPFKKELIHGRRYHSASFFTKGMILMSTPEPLSEETMSLLPRFTKVFDQTYTRFLDLQKAETQAREAQIEAALERTRTQSMLMQHSDELINISKVFHEQLLLLDIPSEFSYVWLPDEANKEHMFWATWAEVEKNSINLKSKALSYDLDKNEPYTSACFKAWESQELFHVDFIPPKDITAFFDTWKELLLGAKKLKEKNFPEGMYYAEAYMKYGCFGINIRRELSDEEKQILARFSKEFERAYTRFLDLQKAENQAREAQIEAALERVRARTMAMQKSEELADVATVLFQQIGDLGIPQWTCGFNIWEPGDTHFTFYPGGPDGEILESCKVPLTEHPIFRQFDESKKRGDKLLVYEKEGEIQADHYKYMHSLPGIGDMLQGMLDSGFKFPDFQIDHVANFAYGNMIFITYEHFPEMHDVFKRFAKVFEQTYTRFLDLQKAEAQAREAQIETALEKVRSRTMAMQKGEEVKDVVVLLYKELIALGVTNFATCGYVEINEKTGRQSTWATSPGGDSLGLFYLPLTGDVYFDERYEAWKNQQIVFHQTVGGEKRTEHLEYAITTFNSKEAEEMVINQFPDPCVFYCFNFSHGYLHLVTGSKLNEEEESLLARFTRVFEQTYARFLDLQKAEKQAREARIEAALERVRSKTMAMHNSKDVEDIVITLFDEVLKLGIDKSIRCGIGILEGTEKMKTWSANTDPNDEVALRVGLLNMEIHPMLVGLKKAWKSGKKGHKYEYIGDDVRIYYKALNDEPDYPFNADLNNLHKREFHESFFFSSGIIFAFSENPISGEASRVLRRFADVFGQTYRRYLDLQKAEAQAREAQIEASLQRVRSRAMAMHNSSEILEAGALLYQELTKLDIPSLTSGYVLMDEDEKMGWNYLSDPVDGSMFKEPIGIPHQETEVMRSLTKSWKKQEPFWVRQLDEQGTIKHQTFIAERSINFKLTAEELVAISPKKLALQSFNFKQGYLLLVGAERLSDDQVEMMLRFTKVFEMTYRRFLDLKQAEAQAREARIETALEKVRSRTMAMQSSTELVEAANLLFKQVRDLGINAWSTGYNVLSEDKTQSECWMSSEDHLQDPFPLYYTEEASFIEMGEFLKSDADFYVQELKGKAIEQHYDYMKSLPELKDTFKHLVDSGLSLPTYQINHLCKFTQGYLLFITYEKSPEAHDIFKRFTKVFEQTYTRFLDLQKAENQSKEAQISLALERVRARSMAMHKSEQLAETAQVLFEQFDLLGAVPDRISIAIINEKKRVFDFWATDQSGSNVNHVHEYSFDEPTCIAKAYKAWKEGKETFIVDLKGKDLKSWIRYVKEEAKMEVDESKFKGRRLQNFAFFSEGALNFSSHLPITEEERELLQRFARVFQESYTRFLDLQKSEAQAKEAVKHASVDRVRAEIASMRTSNDLKRITPLVWNELTTLGVPFIRCGVFIMDEEKQQVQTHLSTPDGKAIASFELPFENTEPLTDLLSCWRKKEIYKDYWDEEAFVESTKILMERGAITSSENFITEHPPTNLHLYFLPFTQGMLYVGSEVSLNEDELSLAQNLAKAFSTAYSRYEDFNKLESANKKIEKTLVDLKQTQTQLVQSEKMASLGELTAGIAHEIQNPLNFVNNFSEVSTELVDEMNEEMEEGNLDFAKEIAVDLKQNLEKINHHGKRAGEIVKGMLQHSRTSSGKKEATDINALADEYLRLAYHGLRAKDKTFNSKMESQFDPDIPKLEVIPQDIGRVILNLITNAFYAVNERKKQEQEGYDPKVEVITRRAKETIEILVSDNGNGMPDHIKEKVFQPFFTTKPTGKGTGLGLSLSYDIVMAHGGEIKVESKENEGTEFIIILPV